MSEIYIHKLTGNKLRLIKKRDNYSTYLVVDNPVKEFWNRLRKNTVICKNENVVLLSDDKFIQKALF